MLRGAFGQGRSRLIEWRLLAKHEGLHVGSGCRFNGVPIVSTADPSCRIYLGNRVTLTSDSRDTALGVNHPVVLRTMWRNASIVIGPDTGISGGSICAARHVSIGAGCLIGANVTIMDTNFHPIDGVDRRHLPLPLPKLEDRVEIGDDVFIGTGAIILQGTRIGDHAVIGAGAVVSGAVDSGVIVAGNPARERRAIRP